MKEIIYLYCPKGYYITKDYAYNGIFPQRATTLEPTLKSGYIPRFTGDEWIQEENHKGVEGYLDGKAHTIKEYGGLPEGFSFEAPLPSLAEAKSSKIEELKSARDRAEQSTVFYDDSEYQCDLTSIMRLNLAYIAYSEPVVWKLADNSEKLLEKEDFEGILKAIQTNSNAVNKKYNALKETVNALEDLLAVQEIAWTD